MAPSPPITIILVDANPFARVGCRSMLESDPGLHVLADVSSPDELDPDLSPDLLIIDPMIDGRFDGTAAQAAMDTYPEAGVLLLTDACKGDFYFPHGYARGVSMLSRTSSPSTLRHAAHIVAEKKVRVTDRRLFDRMLEDGRAATEERRNASAIKLTPREREILSLMATGLSDAEIALNLCISKAAVQTHVGNIVHKAPVQSRFELGLYALSTGLMEYPMYGRNNN